MTIENDPFFEGRLRTKAGTLQGSCELPILYRSGSLLGLLYRVDSTIAQGILGDVPLEPFEILGSAIALLGFFEYRETSIGEYNEIGLAILVKRSASSPSPLQLLRNFSAQDDVGLYVVHLPVNSEIAYASGVELWGFPKYLTEIRTSFQSHKVAVSLRHEIELRHSPNSGLEWKGFPFITFSIKGEQLMRTVTDINYGLRYSSGTNVELSITGSGPTADTIKRLGIDNLSPSLSFYTNELKAVLPAGREIGHIKEA